MITINNVKKHVRYIAETKAYQPSFTRNLHISEQALLSANSLRGNNRPPSLIIHGIMPRSGTVYVSEILRKHPGLFAFPREIWEFPFLLLTGELEYLQCSFFKAYVQNKEKMGQQDFLPLFGSAMIGHLYESVPENQQMLMKIPEVQYLTDFYNVFPHEQLLLLIRDGRDVVASTIRTWRQIRFWMACLRWRRAAEMVYAFHEKHQDRTEGYLLARYEDIVTDPARFVQDSCNAFGLDATVFPFDALENMPVKGSSQTKSNGKVNWQPSIKPADFKPIGRWHEWSILRKSVFKLIAGSALIKLGYSEDNNW
jgi:protein-tyrosine sulfotransferase